ncbi:hypothetical protein P4O66_013993, partial [Electrophorus voltai]
SPRRSHGCCNLSNLTHSQRSAPSHIVVAGGLWNCQSAVQKADFISALASLHFLHFLALTETWITPENSATLAALSSAFSFTHSLRCFGRGGGTGLLMSCEWHFTPLSFSTLSFSSFEFHAITVSFPTKLLIIVIYCAPGSLDHFIDELDILLSQFPTEGNPLIFLGDFNLPSDNLHSFCILLLTAFDLTLNHSPPTHKAGNVLDLIFTRTTTTSDIAVTRLHLSDHHFLSFVLSLSLLFRSSPLQHVPSALQSDYMSAGSNSFCSIPDNCKGSASFHLYQQQLIIWIGAYLSTIDRYHFSLSSQKPLNEQFIINCLFLTQDQLHDPNQSCYKPAHTTETALIVVTEKLHAAKAAKQSSVLILLDLSAAFDTVNQNILLSVLSRLGVTCSAWRWFQSCLDGRSNRVTWRGSTSKPCRLSTGVLQGSVLGSLLFSLYTCSLGDVISSHGSPTTAMPMTLNYFFLFRPLTR